MTASHFEHSAFPAQRATTRFEQLCQDLAEGNNIEIGEYEITSSRAHSDVENWYCALVRDPQSKITTDAILTVQLSQYQNLLGGHVDVRIEFGGDIRTITDSTFTCSRDHTREDITK